MSAAAKGDSIDLGVSFHGLWNAILWNVKSEKEESRQPAVQLLRNQRVCCRELDRSLLWYAFGFRIYGFRFRVSGFGYRISGVGCRV
eukprot:2835109-Rhodomonas_salina.1